MERRAIRSEQSLAALPSLHPDVEVQEIASALAAGAWDISGRAGAHGFVLVSGSGAVRLGEQAVGITAPCAVWLPSGATGTVRLAAGTRGMAFAVSDSALGRVVPVSPIAGPLRESIERPLLGAPTEPAAARSLAEELAAIRREAVEDRPGAREAMMARLGLVLIAFWRLGNPASLEPQASPRVLVHNFLQLVELHARDHWRLEAYARALGISADRLNSAVRRALGLSPLEVVHRRLLESAAAMLEHSNLQVAEIAEALGFRDPAYFNRFFARLAGVSPGRYRRQAGRLRDRPDGSYAAWP